MNTNKTLADVKPGGRVRLGDRLRPCPFCGHSDFDQWPCEYIDASGANVVRCAHCHAAAPMKVWHALSAQPSPGGQDALATALEVFERRRTDIPHEVYEQVKAVCAALAARQLVGEPVAYWLAVDKDGIVEFGMSADDGNEGQAARQEVNDFINGALHDGGVPHRLVGVYAAPPAQAVDLDAMHAAACAAWNKHQEACRITTVTGALRKVCEALLDIQAVGK